MFIRCFGRFLGFLPIFACLALSPLFFGWASPALAQSDEDEAYRAQMEAENSGSGSGSGSSDSYGGYSSGYGQAAGVQTEFMQTYAPGLAGLASGFKLTSLFAPKTDVEIQTGPVLSREAEQAFAAGNQALALELMCGHIATEYDEARVAISMVKFSPTLKRPVWNERWAVSIAVRGSEDVSDPKPIREGTTAPGRATASSGGGYPSGYTGGDSGGGDEQRQREMEEQARSAAESYGGPDGNPSMASAAVPRATVREMLSSEAATTMDENLGLVADVIAEEFAERFGRGDFGSLFTTIAAPEMTDSLSPVPPPATPLPPTPRVSAELDEALSDASGAAPMWRPGLTYLGSGSSAEIIPLAKSENIDFLLHFDVLLKPGRDDSVQNVSRCRLYNMATGKQLALTKSIDSVEAAQLISTGRAANERAYIKDQIASLTGIIDRDAKAVAMPTTLTADVAKRRVAALIGGPSSKTLRTLAEIRLYQSLNLLTQQDVEMAFDIIGGPEGLMLLHGPYDERLLIARKWAVASQPVAKQ